MDTWIQDFAKIKFTDAKPLNIESLQKLKDFNSKRKLHAAIFQYVASQLVSSEEEYQIREIFTLLDDNGDGTITKDELAKGIDIFRERFGLKGDIGDIDDIVQKIDVDGSGTIDFREFLSATINTKRVVQDDVLRQAFNLFDIVSCFLNTYIHDQDGDGTITKKELQRVLGGVFIMSEEQWEEFIKEVDTSGNGMVSTALTTFTI